MSWYLEDSLNNENNYFKQLDDKMHHPSPHQPKKKKKKKKEK